MPGNAILAASFYVVQRSCGTPLYGRLAPWFVFAGFNTAIVIACSGFLMGVTAGLQTAEAEWYAALWLTLVWVVYLAVFIGTLWRRRVRRIYVSNWFFLAAILYLGVWYAFDSLAVPVSLFGTKSYTLHTNVQGALINWGYGKAVAFFLIAGFLGSMCYLLPERLGRPLFSYRLAIAHFWALLILFLWFVPGQLHYTSYPDWAQQRHWLLAIALLAFAWGGVLNGLVTLSGHWKRLLTDPAIRFLTVPVAFYSVPLVISKQPADADAVRGAVLLFGAVFCLAIWLVPRKEAVSVATRVLDTAVCILLVLLLTAKAGKPVNLEGMGLEHGHWRDLGWVAMLAFGTVYALVPQLWPCKAPYSRALTELHFWLCLSAILIHGGTMWLANIMQSLMSRATDQAGFLTYGFEETVRAIQPFFLDRAAAGALFLAGIVPMIVNLLLTVNAKPANGANAPVQDGLPHER